jgi:hypothetical protein
MDSTPFSKTTRKINKKCFEKRMDQLHQQTIVFKNSFEDPLKANLNPISNSLVCFLLCFNECNFSICFSTSSLNVNRFYNNIHNKW